MSRLLIQRDVRYELIVDAPKDGKIPMPEIQDMEVVNDNVEVTDYDTGKKVAA